MRLSLAGRTMRGLMRCGWAALVAWGFATQAAQPAAWSPEKAIELISPSSPGGGTDNTVRLMQKIWQNNRYFETPLTVVNKPGGAQAVSLAYLKQHGADAHYLLVVGGAIMLGNQISGKSAHNYTDFTALALLNSEYVAFAVKADSPIKSTRDLAARLRDDAGSVSFAVGTGLGGPNHVAAALLARAAGGDVKKLKTVVFKSSSESAVALLGGHVDVITTSASVILPQLTSRVVRILALAAPRRVQGLLAGAATLKEQGYDVVVDNFRLALASPGLQPAQIVFWDDALARLAQTREWRHDLDENLWEATYLNSRDTRTFLDAQYLELKTVLTELGMAK